MFGWIICPALLLLAVIGFAGDKIFYRLGEKKTSKELSKRFIWASCRFEILQNVSIIALVVCLIVFMLVDSPRHYLRLTLEDENHVVHINCSIPFPHADTETRTDIAEAVFDLDAYILSEPYTKED